MILLVLASILRQSFSNFVANLVIASLVALTPLAMQPFLLDIPKSQIFSILDDFDKMTNMAILICLEMTIFVAWCFSGFKNFKYSNVLKFFPGITFVPVIWYLQAQSFYYFPGVKFEQITYGIAIATFAIILLAPLAVRYIIPERELRRELVFIIALVAILLAAVAPAQATPVFRNPQNPQWLSLLALLSVVILLSTTGYLIKRLNINPVARVGKLLRLSQRQAKHRKVA